MGSFLYQFRVQALAFDGLDAFLLNELIARESNSGPHVFYGRYLILGTNDYSGENATTDFTVHEWRNSRRVRGNPARPNWPVLFIASAWKTTCSWPPAPRV